jgi:hypothetical protein
MLAAIREYLARRTIALGAAAVLVIGLLSWNVLLQAQTEPSERQVQRRAG